MANRYLIDVTAANSLHLANHGEVDVHVLGLRLGRVVQRHLQFGLFYSTCSSFDLLAVTERGICTLV